MKHNNPQPPEPTWNPITVVILVLIISMLCLALWYWGWGVVTHAGWLAPPIVANLFKTSRRMKTADRWIRDAQRRKITEAIFGPAITISMVLLVIFLILVISGTIPICFLSNQTPC